MFERSESALVGQGVAIGLPPEILRLLLRHDLIDEVLCLSELESGARVVALGATPVAPVLY